MDFAAASSSEIGLDSQALAVVGNRVLSNLVELTTDLDDLDRSPGPWAVIINFDGSAVCARFAHSSPARPWPGIPWPGLEGGLAAWATSLDRYAFVSDVDTIRDHIAVGRVYQVNLTRILSAALPDQADVAALGAALAVGNPAPYSAVVRIPELGIHVASASPELFVSRHGAVVRSSPIKGTAATIDGFLPKDQAENVMIVDLVRNDLSRICEWGTVRTPRLCDIEAHPGLFHLVSTVEGRLSDSNGWRSIIEATFPPGSVTGAPKIEALKVIAELEPVSRGPYCGAIGWVEGERGELNVAIRTFWFENNRLCFGTGGGITWDSDPEGEWQETELKARNLIALASRSGRERL